MTEEQKMVLEFHRRFEQPCDVDITRPMTAKEERFRVAFLREEVEEFSAATDNCNTIQMIDGLCDIIYVAHGTALLMGLDLEPFYREVHRSNMDKVGGGTRADGKILKPVGWNPPDLESIYRGLLK